MFQQCARYGDPTTKGTKITNAEQKNKLTIPLCVLHVLRG
jgi:hypothetical protein